MAVVKRKRKVDRAAAKADTARLLREGKTYREVGKILGVSAPQVCYDAKQIMDDYRQSAIMDKHSLTIEKILQFKDVRAASWDAWERSQESDDGDVRRAGDAQFLRIALETLKGERELLGLDAPTKTLGIVGSPVDWAAVLGGDSGAKPDAEAQLEALEARARGKMEGVEFVPPGATHVPGTTYFSEAKKNGDGHGQEKK